MPSALHHVRGVAVTLTGVNFHPSGRYDGFENEVSDLAYGVGESSVAGDDAICTFDAPKDPGSISQGVNVGQWSFACSLPGRLGTGFVNVGIGSVGQEDARFLYGPEFLIHLLATPVFYNVICHQRPTPLLGPTRNIRCTRILHPAEPCCKPQLN